jgi:hypothetical protein
MSLSLAQTILCRFPKNVAVQSSVTAEQFYAKLGFRALRDSYHGDERNTYQKPADTSLGGQGGDDAACASQQTHTI